MNLFAIIAVSLLVGTAIGYYPILGELFEDEYHTFVIVLSSLLVVVTGAMAVYLYKTLNHNAFVESSKILDSYRTKFFNAHREIYNAIMYNDKTDSGNIINYDKLENNDGRHKLIEMLLDLEMLAIMIKYDAVEETIMFEIFGQLLRAIKDDQQIRNHIGNSRNLPNQKLLPYSGLLDLIKRYDKYNQKMSAYSLISSFRR